MVLSEIADANLNRSVFSARDMGKNHEKNFPQSDAGEGTKRQR